VNTDNWSGFACASINPGKTNDFLVDFSGTGQNLTPVSLTAAEMGFGKPTRLYTALDMYLEHPMRNGSYGRINYTLSRSRGNTEGQTLSAVAQTDVAATTVSVRTAPTTRRRKVRLDDCLGIPGSMHRIPTRRQS
jgi:hypothetical protein